MGPEKENPALRLVLGPVHRRVPHGDRVFFFRPLRAPLLAGASLSRRPGGSALCGFVQPVLSQQPPLFSQEYDRCSHDGQRHYRSGLSDPFCRGDSASPRDPLSLYGARSDVLRGNPLLLDKAQAAGGRPPAHLLPASVIADRRAGQCTGHPGLLRLHRAAPDGDGRRGAFVSRLSRHYAHRASRVERASDPRARHLCAGPLFRHNFSDDGRVFLGRPDAAAQHGARGVASHRHCAGPLQAGPEKNLRLFLP